MSLSLRTLNINQTAKITKITADRRLARRIMDMGILPGMKIKLIGVAPLFDPVAIKVGDTVLTLRNNEADYIFIELAGV